MHGYQSLRRSGRFADDGGRAEHEILVTAEHQLLSSLARERSSRAVETPLAFRTTQLRDADDPTFQRASFGEGAAEVRRLADKGPGGDGIRRRLEGVAAMRASRAERHDATVRAWRVERRHITDEVLRNAVQLCVSTFRDRLRASDLRIEAATAAYADETNLEPLLALEEADLRRAWDVVVAEVSEREALIASLCDDGRARPPPRARVPRTIPLAHHRRPRRRRAPHPRRRRALAAAETTELNKASVEDRRSSAELLRRLRVREIRRERDEKSAYEIATRRWREGKTNRAIERFLETIRDDRFADPPERRAALAELAEDQAAAHASISEHAADAARRFVDADGSLALTSANARRWCERLEARLEAWDGAAKRAFEKMASCAADVDERVNREYATTRDAVAAYSRGDVRGDARGDGVLDDANDDSMHALLTERCAPTLAKREADAAAYARRVETRVETQANEWRTRTRRVGAFLERVAALVETHRFLATRASEANVEASAARRARHVRRDESNEAAVREAREAIARAADEMALDEATARATAALIASKANTAIFSATRRIWSTPTRRRWRNTSTSISRVCVARFGSCSSHRRPRRRPRRRRERTRETSGKPTSGKPTSGKPTSGKPTSGKPTSGSRAGPRAGSRTRACLGRTPRRGLHAAHARGGASARGSEGGGGARVVVGGGRARADVAGGDGGGGRRETRREDSHRHVARDHVRRVRASVRRGRVPAAATAGTGRGWEPRRGGSRTRAGAGAGAGARRRRERRAAAAAAASSAHSVPHRRHRRGVVHRTHARRASRGAPGGYGGAPRIRRGSCARVRGG